MEALAPQARASPSVLPKGIVILSGGLDSTVLLYHVRKDHDIHAVSFDYGQRHKKELESAIKICKALGVPHKVFSAPIGIKGSLSGPDPVPHGHYEAESMKSTVVPNRNMVMIAITGSYAPTIGATEIFYGAHKGDHAIYPDCRPEFVEALDKALYLGNLWENGNMSVRLHAPFLDRTKAEIVKIGSWLGVPFGLTWSCYEGREKACGKCGTCTERRLAFKESGVEDPVEYE